MTIFPYISLRLVSRWQWLSACSLVVFLMSGCAKETSKEERKREETDRQFRRIQKAEGHYLGYVAVDESRLIPLSVDLIANRNPSGGGDTPNLSAAVRVGMFGGIIVSSGTVTFDWGSGLVSISLPKQATAQANQKFSDDEKLLPADGVSPTAPLEIRGIVGDSGFSGGVIDGPSSGRHPIVLAKDGPNLFSEQDHYSYQVEVSQTLLTGPLKPNAQVSIKRLPTPRAAPNTADLPLFPSLDGSVRFNNMGIVTDSASDVIYDPLLGYMEFEFGPNTSVRFEGLYLNKKATSSGLADWKPDTVYSGNVIQGGAIYGHVRMGSDFPGVGLTDDVKVADLPPPYYLGTFTTKSETPRTFTSIAALEYQNSRGTNSADYPFPFFPKMKLRIIICDGTHKLETHTLDMTVLDPVRNLARFQVLDTSSKFSVIDVAYGEGWSKFSGTLKTDQSESIDTTNPQYHFSENPMPIFDCTAVGQ